jgi:hypothetical protein
MLFVLQRNEDGKFVAPAGAQRSYVKSLQDARAFTTREAAEQERCGNESIVVVRDVMGVR